MELLVEPVPGRPRRYAKLRSRGASTTPGSSHDGWQHMPAHHDGISSAGSACAAALSQAPAASHLKGELPGAPTNCPGTFMAGSSGLMRALRRFRGWQSGAGALERSPASLTDGHRTRLRAFSVILDRLAALPVGLSLRGWPNGRHKSCRCRNNWRMRGGSTSRPAAGLCRAECH